MNRSVVVLFLLAALAVLGCSEATPPAKEQQPSPAPVAPQPTTESKDVGGSTGGAVVAEVPAAKEVAR